MDSRFIPYEGTFFGMRGGTRRWTAGPRGGGRAEPCASVPRQERKGGIRGYAWARRRIADSKSKPDPWRLFRDMSMNFFSFMDRLNTTAAPWREIPLALPWHSSVVLRRGRRRFRYR